MRVITSTAPSVWANRVFREVRPVQEQSLLDSQRGRPLLSSWQGPERSDHIAATEIEAVAQQQVEFVGGHPPSSAQRCAGSSGR